MKRELIFRSFLSFLYFKYDGNDFTELRIQQKHVIFKNSKDEVKIPIDIITNISLSSNLLFSDITISTYQKDFKLINTLLWTGKNYKRFLDYYINYENLKKEFALYDSVTNFSQYVSYSLNLKVLKIIRNSILFKFKNLPFNKEKRKECNKYLKLYKKFLNDYERIRNYNNEKFIIFELNKYKEFFNTIESNPLTKMQRVSIITNEDNNLIVAGAGSGKTSVIIGKILYLLDKKLANSSEILVLAFNNKAQKEIQERLAQKTDINIDIKTFHSLGNYILKLGNNKKNLSPFATDDLGFKNLIKTIIKDNLKNNIFAEIMKTYFQEFFYPSPDIEKFKVEGDYYNYLENFEIRTFNKEKVKSLEECYIANFLYLNGIKYIYEKPYPYDCGSFEYGIYKPDFYLPDYDIYIEHFAINKHGVTPDFIDCKRYLEGINWKRNTHNTYHTKLIETYSWEHYEGTLLQNLKNKLLKNKVKFEPIDKTKIYEKLNEAQHIDSFTELTSAFLNHYKSNQLNFNNLWNSVNSRLNSYTSRKNISKTLEEKRNQAFLKIFAVIYNQYNKYLKEKNENDFNDMILLATKFVQMGLFKSDYKYILVDEFQDISKGRALLLKALIQNSNAKLFCVGDDWQSIYRFTGSDISIMTNFEKEFGYTKRIDLDLTFRFNNQINDVASKFIMQNKNQLEKHINTIKKSELPSVLIFYENKDKDTISTILNEINKEAVETKKNNILILSRFNKLKDKDKTQREKFKSQLESYRKTFPNLNIEFSSVHGSKGLGFDYVILIDMNRGAFPLQKIDDPILNMVLPKPESFPNAEERRLFYVALTRTKEKIFIITSSKPSSFIEELENGKYNIGIYGDPENSLKLKCPKCGTGLLIKSNSKKSFICSHTTYCDFTTPVCDICGKGYIEYNSEKHQYECNNPRCHETKQKCPACEDGYLIKREGKFGEFFGCSNYPNCKYTTKHFFK